MSFRSLPKMIRAMRFAVYVVTASVGFGASSYSQTPSGFSEAMVSVFEASKTATLTAQVRNLHPTFHWIGATDQFWFRHQLPQGHEFVRVDAARGRRSPLFDHIALARVLSAANGRSVAATALPIEHIQVQADGSFIFEMESGALLCDPPVRKCSAAASRNPAQVTAPDGRSRLVLRADNLWLVSTDGNGERQLTRDGVPGFGYGDVDPYLDTMRVARRRAGAETPLRTAMWSPDGRYIVTLRQDLRAFPERPLVTEYVPPDGSFAVEHKARMPLASDERRADTKLSIIEVATGAAHDVQIDAQAFEDFAVRYFLAGYVWWTASSDQLFLITANRGGSRYALTQIDLASGSSLEALHEQAQFNLRLNQFSYARPNVFVTANGREALWYSERSGHGTLYLHDVPSGKLKRRLVEDERVIFDLLHVDEARRLAYFTAADERAAGNPYYAHLYRVSLDGGVPQLLTSEAAHHAFANGNLVVSNPRWGAMPGASIAPSGRYFVDSFSTVSQAPQAVVRDSRGKKIMDLLTADVDALFAGGWRPPERIVAKAADGTTELHGVLFRPRDFNPQRRYAVVDYMYPGPQGRFAPISFAEALGVGSMSNAQALADAGFIVVALDGRATSYRSSAFHDAFQNTDDPLGAADHVAAIRDLASQRPYMDLRRVGVMGQSFGGYGSLRAMLLNPDFFTVGVSATGPANWLNSHQEASAERTFGVPATAVSVRKYYDAISNVTLAERLAGRLLLIYGARDENVPLKLGMEAMQAFVRAGKRVDMLIIPDGTHADAGFGNPYTFMHALQYFNDQLGAPTEH